MSNRNFKVVGHAIDGKKELFSMKEVAEFICERGMYSEVHITTECMGTDISAWVNYEDISSVSIALSDIASYRINGASKAVPGFDVIDYGQEDYVFGDSEQDARHWNTYLLEIFEEYADTLAPCSINKIGLWKPKQKFMSL